MLKLKDHLSDGSDHLRHLRNARLEINIVHCNTVLSVRRQWPEALSVLSKAKQWGLRATVVSFGGALNTTPWRRGAELLRQMQILQVEINTICSNAAIKAMPRWRSSAFLLVQMKLLHLEPNDMTTTLLSRGEAWRSTIQRFDHGSTGFQRNTFGFNAIIGTAGWTRALALLELMVVTGVQLDIVSLNSVLTAMVHSADGWCLATMTLECGRHRGLRQDTITLGTMLKSFKEGHAWPRALHLLRSWSSGVPLRCC